MSKSFSPLIEPNSIAIVGASSDPEKIGFQILNNIMKSGYLGRLYAVNPKPEKILGISTISSIADIEGNLDLVVIAIPHQYVLPIVRECSSKKVGAIVIISAGFAEMGLSGKETQDEISKICDNNNILLLGPNCLGLINTDMGLNASFAADYPKNGNIALLSQSGAIISALIDWSLANNLGFSKVFSMGNEAQLDETSLLQYLYDDPKTDVILAYLEHLDVTEKLTQVLQRSSEKPTIVLFGGKSESGSEAALSHTGSIVGSYLAIKTYLNQHGVVVANGFEDLSNFARLFSRYRKMTGNKVALITNAGGPSIATCDELALHNLELAELSTVSNSKLEKSFRAESNISNPIDLLGDASADDYRKAIEIADQDTGVDAILVLLTRQSSTNVNEISNAIGNTKTSKPLVCVYMGGESLLTARRDLENKQIPCFEYPEGAVRALASLTFFSEKHAVENCMKVTTEFYNERLKSQLLDENKIPYLKYKVAKKLDEAIEFAHAIGYPVVAKTGDPKVVHKSDVGGVVLNIMSDKELEHAFQILGQNIIIGQMLKGYEIFLGIKKHPGVGTVVAFGTGGIYSEIYNDFSYRTSPINPKMALSMIEETKMGQILSGVRGNNSLDLELLSEVIVNVVKFADKYNNITEIDLNPLIGNKDGFCAVDVRIVSEKGHHDKN